MKDLIYCIGANHRTASIELRESFFIASDQLRDMIKPLMNRFGFSEVVVLSTCNRFEIIVVANSPLDASHDVLIEVWMELQQAKLAMNSNQKTSPKLQAGQLREKTYCLAGAQAIQHVFRVASSLDSLVPGETQITGQFRDAIALASETSTLGPILSRLAQEAMTTSKKIRSQTSIGRRTVSISHAAISLAKRMFENLNECRFLIIGTGEMGRVAAAYATSYRPKMLYLANRTKDKAAVIANQLRETHEQIDILGLEDLPVALKNADVVIVATSAPNFVVTSDMIQILRRQESINTPIFLIDIAMPRNIDPNCSQFEDVYLFDIDDLKQVVDQNLDDRKTAANQGEEFVVQASDVFTQWLATQKLVPVMEAWRNHVAKTLMREAEKTLAKDIFSDLSTEQRKSLELMLDSVTSKLTGDLAQSLRAVPSDEAIELAKSVGQVFGLSTHKKPTKEQLS